MDTKAKSTTVFTKGKAEKILQEFKAKPFHSLALVYANNPAAFLLALRRLNLINIVNPDTAQIDAVLNRLLFRKDYADIKTLMTTTPYVPQADNWTVNPNLWAALYLKPGDFIGLYNTYVSKSN